MAPACSMASHGRGQFHLLDAGIGHEEGNALAVQFAGHVLSFDCSLSSPLPRLAGSQHRHTGFPSGLGGDRAGYLASESENVRAGTEW